MKREMLDGAEQEAMKRYLCKRKNAADFEWEHIEGVRLSEVVTGGEALLQTEVKACWDETNLYFHFICEDDYTVATMTERDDPIYMEDVVEIFIDENGSGRSYMEFEISPNNVLFDALIENDLMGRIAVNTAWNPEGMQTSVIRVDRNHLVYDVMIPCGIFTEQPRPGSEYRINFYRIDETPDGVRHYFAWSPIGKVNFHMPQSFGTLVLE